jgi:catechol 2,3-dioxygenase-like lactoylglutathione lyase family enzyme
MESGVGGPDPGHWLLSSFVRQSDHYHQHHRHTPHATKAKSSWQEARSITTMASPLATKVRFGRALLMVRGSNGVAAAVNFYQNGLGMNIIRHTDEWAELSCPVGSSATQSSQPQMDGNFNLTIQACESEAQLGAGYSPFLNFDVDDMDSTVARCVQMGAHLDGPIQCKKE